MTTLVISSKFQRYGIGRRLIAEAEMLAWEHGCGRIEITSGDQRGDAHAFYEAVGYEQVSRRFIKFRPLSADLTEHANLAGGLKAGPRAECGDDDRKMSLRGLV
jgi:ribosomal protein S18 acetylase RimI-like enzyme